MIRVCKICAVEHNIRRGGNWSALGHCPICDEAHALFEVLPTSLEHTELLIEREQQRREDLLEYQNEQLRGLDRTK